MKKIIYVIAIFCLMFQLNPVQAEEKTGDKYGITITKPDIFSIFNQGDTVRFKWGSDKKLIPKVDVQLIDENYYKSGLPVYIAKGIKNKNSFKWKIPENMPPNKNYAVAILESTKELNDESAYTYILVSEKGGKQKVEESLKNARMKGSNAAAKANLANARAQAEFYYDTNSYSYKSVCTKDSGINNIDGGIKNSVSEALKSVGTKSDCDDSKDAWAAEVLLQGDEGFFCVDSTGSARTSKESKGNTSTVCK